MNAAEHYHAAEHLLAEATTADSDGYSADRDPGHRDSCLLEAQVHAVLALTAAMRPAVAFTVVNDHTP